MLRKPKQIMENGVLFNLWAPSATSVELLEVGQSPRALSCDDDGWYQGFSPTVPAAATSSGSTASSLFLTLPPIFSPTT
jgi:1,4-alpha-glucan branching enzyme